MSRARAARSARWLALLATIGPGILSLAGDNDAGGLLAYAATGAHFGPALFLPLLLPLALLAFAVQEMAMRLGVVSGHSLPQLLRARVSRSWAYLVAADLALQNAFLLTTEFVGMGIGLAYFGLPLTLGVPLSALLVAGLVVGSPYRTAERLALPLAVLSLVLVPVAVAARPSLGALRLPPADAPGLGFYLVAAVGNALAPWMVFFQAQAVRDKGLGEQQLRAARLDLAAGTAIQVSVAAAVLLLGTLAAAPFTPDSWLHALALRVSPLAGALMAAGLFDAGLVAAVTVSFASTWAVAETCTGRAQATSWRSAPWVYALYLLGVAGTAGVVLLPGLPLDLVAVGAQAAAALLMPPVLVVLVLLLNDPAVMPRHRNNRLGNLAGVAATALFTLAALLLLWRGPIG